MKIFLYFYIFFYFNYFSLINLLIIPLTKPAFLSPAWRTRVSPAGNVINTQCGPTHHTCTLGGQDPQVRDIRQHLLKLNRQVGQVSRCPQLAQQLAPPPHPLVSFLSQYPIYAHHLQPDRYLVPLLPHPDARGGSIPRILKIVVRHTD